MTAASDVISDVLGNFGKWQIRVMLIIFLCKLPTSWFMAVIIFTAPQPNAGDFYCRPPDILPNEYRSDWIGLAHPVHLNRQNELVTDYCKVYREIIDRPFDYIGPNATKTIASNASAVRCDHFAYDANYHSLVADFNLVCRRQLLLPLTQCFHIFGLLVGGIVAFLLMKWLSPKRVLLIGMITQVIFGNLTGMARIYEFHVLFRCLSASSCALMYTSGQSIFLDITHGRARKIVAVVFELFWSIGLIMLPVVSLFIDNWWNLYRAISMPTIALVFLYRYLPDSPRWLLRHGHIEQTKKILIEGGRKNKRPIPCDLEDLLKQEIDSGRANPVNASWCSVWSGNPKRRYLLAVHYAWSVYVLLFNCMVLNIRAYGRDHLSINTVAIGFSEIFGVLIGLYLILYTRRRWLWAGCLGIASGCLAYFTWLIPNTLEETHVVALEMIPSMAIKMATSTGLCILMTCTADLVTQEKKKMLMLSAVIWSRAWFLWAPFIFVLRMYDNVLPLTVFATLIVFGGILMSVVNYSHLKSFKEVNQAKNSQEKKPNIVTISDGVEKMKDNYRAQCDINREV